MNKKFLIIGAILVLMAMVFTSCDLLAGEGDTSGIKYSKTMNVDGSNKDSKGKDLTETDEGYLAKNYRRFFSKISDDEETGWISTTIEVDPSKTILGFNPDGSEITTINNNAVQGMACANFGYIFDFHTTKAEGTNQDVLDFCLIGIQPATGRYYVERYEGINYSDIKDASKAGDAPLDVNDAAIANYYTFGTSGTTFGETKGQAGDWRNLPNGVLETNYKKDGETVDNYSITINIKQSTFKDNTNGVAGRYDIYIGDTYIGYYEGQTKLGGNGEYKDFCVGGIGCYASCAKGTKISAKYKTTRNSTLTSVEKNVGPKFTEYGAEPTLD